jgi:membrane protein
MATDARSRSEAIRDFGRRVAEIAQERVPGAPAVVESFERERAAGSGLLAGGVAYRFFIWLVPFGLVLAGIAGFWVDTDPRGLESAARQFGLAGAAARSARAAFESGEHSRWYLLVAGLVLLVWFGTSAVRALRVAHAIAWADRITRLRRPVAASFLFSGVVVGVTALGVGTRWVANSIGDTAGLLVTLGMFAVYAGAALASLNLLPHADAPWTALVPGALVFAIGMQLMHLVVVLYLAPKLEQSPHLYGAFGGATVVLLWLYLIARLIISAAFFNATLWDRRRGRE